MNSLYLSNCLLCEAPLNDASIDSFCLLYCSKETEHFSYDMTHGIIITVHEYGKYHFYINNKDISSIIFQHKGSGERIWFRDNLEELMYCNEIELYNPTIDDIPSIIERLEIRNIFK